MHFFLIDRILNYELTQIARSSTETYSAARGMRSDRPSSRESHAVMLELEEKAWRMEQESKHVHASLVQLAFER